MVFIICIHVHLKSSWALHHSGVRYRHAYIFRLPSVSVLCNANASPLKCINVCRHIKLKITDASRLHPGHAHTTSHNPLSLFNIKDCGSSSKQMPWQDSLSLCLRFPCDRWRGDTQQSLSFFLLFQKQHNCYLFLPSSFAVVFAADLTMVYSEAALQVYLVQ